MRDPQTPNVDAVVIGAGFGGIYMLHKLRNGLGLKVRVYDKAGGVGGTWYWNKYPGAMSDTEAHIYQYSFDKQMLQDWDWKNRYWNQPDILAYLQAVVERHDLAKDIRLNTSIESLVFSDASNSWIVTTGDGETSCALWASCRRLTCPTSRAATPFVARWSTPVIGRRTSRLNASGWA